MNRDVLMMLAAIKQGAQHPDLFADDERAALVDWLMVCISSPDNWVAIKAAEVVIAMEARNIAAERLADSTSEFEPWATHSVPT